MKLKISFYLRTNHLNKNGEYPVMFRVSNGNERQNFGSTGITLPLEFSLKRNRAVRLNGTHSGISEYNRQLTAFEYHIRSTYEELRKKGQYSLHALKVSLLSEKSLTSNTEILFLLKKAIKLSEKKRGNPLVYHLSKFLENNDKMNLDIKELSPFIIERFQEDLHGKISVNTASEHLRFFKQLYKRVVKELHLYLEDPFEDLVLRRIPTTRTFITEEEIHQMQIADLENPRLVQTRDYFLFACYTGLSYSDVLKLKKQHIRKIGGRVWIQKPREKTKVLSNILLIQSAVDIMEAYTCDDSDLIFPKFPKIATLTYRLKRLSEACGLRPLTYHMARHTFATLALTKGVSIESVSKILGHSDIQTTQIYGKIINKKIEQDMLLFEERISYIG